MKHLISIIMIAFGWAISACSQNLPVSDNQREETKSLSENVSLDVSLAQHDDYLLSVLVKPSHYSLVQNSYADLVDAIAEELSNELSVVISGDAVLLILCGPSPSAITTEFAQCLSQYSVTPGFAEITDLMKLRGRAKLKQGKIPTRAYLRIAEIEQEELETEVIFLDSDIVPYSMLPIKGELVSAVKDELGELSLLEVSLLAGQFKAVGGDTLCPPFNAEAYNDFAECALEFVSAPNTPSERVFISPNLVNSSPWVYRNEFEADPRYVLLSSEPVIMGAILAKKEGNDNWTFRYSTTSHGDRKISGPPGLLANQLLDPAIDILRNHQIRVQKRKGYRANLVLEKDLFFCRRSTGDIYIVPAGFVTDLMSIDKTVRTTLLRFTPSRIANDSEIAASVIHDWLFALGPEKSVDPILSEKNRLIAEDIFEEEMSDYRMGGYERNLISGGTRMGGKSSFGLPEEMRFATEESCLNGRRFLKNRDLLIVDTIDIDLPPGKKCAGFQQDYTKYYSQYRKHEPIQVDAIALSYERSAYFETVTDNENKAMCECADKICKDGP